MITDTRISQSVSRSSTSPEGHDVMTQTGFSHTRERSAGMFSGQRYKGGVLVVDDEDDIRRVLTITLEKEGYYVVNAEDGEQAIRLINEGEHPMVIDVIITDIRMPKVNGIQAIEFFQREYPSVPLIVLTAFPEVNLATQLLKRGVTDFLVKPVDREKLKLAVADAMGARHRDWFA